MAERTIKIGSAGKIFSLTGWKVGWMVAAPETGERRGAGAPVPDLLHRAQSAGGGGLRARTRATPGSRRCEQRFARARDRMTRGAGGGRLRGARRAPRPISCASTSRPRASTSTTRRSPRGGRAGGGRGGPAVAVRRGRSAAPLVRLCFGKKRRNDRRRGRGDGPRAGDCAHEPGRRSRATLLQQFGVDATAAICQLFADRRQPRSGGSRAGDPRRPPASARSGVPASGAPCRRRAAASWSGCSARNCAPPRSRWPGWSRSRPARSSRRASAKSRR